MDRRSKTSRGYVNFPVDSEKWKSSGEGGMFIRLVVAEKKDIPFDDLWMVCCGGYNYTTLDESYQVDDLGNPEEYHFPNINNYEGTDESRYDSVGYLAALTIGSTGWSGWNGDEHWHCTYEDLTLEGKQLYDSLKALYGDKYQVLLQTWLDT